MSIKIESDRDRLLEEFKSVEDTGLNLVRAAEVYATRRDGLAVKLAAGDLTDLTTRNNQIIASLKNKLSIT